MDTKSAGLWAALMNWLNSSQSDAQPAGQQVAEEASKVLPGEVMPRGAIDKKREELAALDALLREQ